MANILCYNCGERGNHYSRNCPLDQEWKRCRCGNVARSPASHKLSCTNQDFVSKKIGSYELPLMEYHQCRFSFKNVNEIYCAQSTTAGNQNFLITKILSIGTTIHLRKVYGTSNDLVLDVKYKPAITLSIGRMSSIPMVSIMLAENQIRVNHYQHIDKNGNVSYNLKDCPRKDANHDVVLKMPNKDERILFSLCWNNNITAKFTMSSKASTIHGEKLHF